MAKLADQSKELQLLIRSRHPLVVLRTLEEDRAQRLVVDACQGLIIPLFVWSLTDGLVNSMTGEKIPDTAEPGKALAAIAKAGVQAVYLLKDLAPSVCDPVIQRRLRDLAALFARDCSTMIVLAPAPPNWPVDLERWVATYHLKLPDQADLDELVRGAIRQIAGSTPLRTHLTHGQYQRLLESLRGLTSHEAVLAINRVMLDDGCLDENDLGRLMAAKQELVARRGLLEFIPPDERLTDVGGLERLKKWLQLRQSAFTESGRQYGLVPPRGLLLLGVQGCGKSLACKSVGASWSLPILRMDPGVLYSKYVGESEQRFAEACELAEAMAPCVLWIDEIEKAFASAGSPDSDGGLTRRVFGSFLSWLQEHPAGVFVAATANDISALPPELMRKGRFDEIFFVDLPTPAEREEIFRLHLTRRERRPEELDLSALAAASEGFSGAEIEQAIVSAMYVAYADRCPLTTEQLVAELAATYPLSVTQAERITQLRHWARSRCVPAGGANGSPGAT